MLKVTCPNCGESLNIPEEYAGQKGVCNKCGGSLTVPREVVLPVVPVSKPKKQKVLFEIPIYSNLVKIVKTKTGLFKSKIEFIVADSFDEECFKTHYGMVGIPTIEDVEQFIRFFFEKEAFKHLVKKQRWHSFNSACAAWLHLRRFKAENDRLKKSIQCIGFMSRNVQCANNTKSANGLCRHHDKPGQNNIWNCEWWSSLDEGDSHQRSIEEERKRREEKWRKVAEKINYSATHRQIYFLLDLGVEPEQLEGITRGAASSMIHKRLDEKD